MKDKERAAEVVARLLRSALRSLSRQNIEKRPPFDDAKIRRLTAQTRLLAEVVARNLVLCHAAVRRTAFLVAAKLAVPKAPALRL